MKSFIYLLSLVFQDFVTALNHNPATNTAKSDKTHILSLGLKLLWLGKTNNLPIRLFLAIDWLHTTSNSILPYLKNLDYEY
jgi:hypothetical protein